MAVCVCLSIHLRGKWSNDRPTEQSSIYHMNVSIFSWYLGLARCTHAAQCIWFSIPFASTMFTLFFHSFRLFSNYKHVTDICWTVQNIFDGKWNACDVLVVLAAWLNFLSAEVCRKQKKKKRSISKHKKRQHILTFDRIVEWADHMIKFRWLNHCCDRCRSVKN